MSEKMDNDRDVDLSRMLKNWAAHQRPPSHSRERLLRAAVEPYHPAESMNFLNLVRELLAPGPVLRQDPRILGPFSQSRALWFHQATPTRMLT